MLGESTVASELETPAVTAGPGYILPDSPLYFVDKIFQTVRIAAAFTPDRKAKIRSEIAGERLAELRIMLAKNNSQGISTAISQLTKETDLTAQDLGDAASRGKDVKILAKGINETIKIHRAFLGTLASQSQGAMKLQFQAAREALQEAKVEVEDELSEDELEHEINEALEEEVKDEMEDASNSTEALERVLEKFQKQVSESAKKALSHREEAIKQAIENKNEALKREYEQLFTQEKKKQETLLKTHENASREAKEAAEKTRKAAENIKESREEIKRIEAQPVGSNTSSGSSGGNSGSGRSNSGKD